MTTITVTYTDDEVDKFKRVLFAEDAWTALKSIDAILTWDFKADSNSKQAFDAVRDVLADVLWRVD